MRVVLHAGTNKAGSTTIQRTLSSASARLLQHGVLYPVLDGHESHTRLLFAITDDDEFTKQYNRGTAEGALATRAAAEQQWAELAKIVFTETPQTLILSTEYAIGLRSRSWARLVERLRTWCDDIELVLYLRSPVTHYLSAAQQQLKFGHRVRDPGIGLTYRRDYKHASEWPADRFTVKALEKTRLLDGCVCRDFLISNVGLARDLVDQIPTINSNETLSSESIAILQGFNYVNLPGPPRSGNPVSSLLISVLQQAEKKESYTRPQLQPVLRRVLENDAREEVLWLRDQSTIAFQDFPYEAAHAEDPEMADVRKRHEDLTLSDVMFVDEQKLAQLRRVVLRELRRADAEGKHPRLRLRTRLRTLIRALRDARARRKDATFDQSPELLSDADVRYFKELGSLVKRQVARRGPPTNR